MKAGDLIIDHSDGAILLFVEWKDHHRSKRAYMYDFDTQQIYNYTVPEIDEHLEVISYG